MPSVMMGDVSKQSCKQDELKEGVFWADSENKQLLTPTNIVGYYLRMIKSYLSATEKYHKVDVKPALNKELNEDFGDPFIVIKRDILSAQNLGVNGNKTKLPEALPDGIANFGENYPEASLADSVMYSDLMTMGVHLNIYGTTSAEVEAIGNVIFPLVMATSYDALKNPFPFIQYVNPPTMMPVEVVEKHSEVYTLTISWSIIYRDDTVLLIKKNVIKYATIVVREELEERVIYRFDN